MSVMGSTRFLKASASFAFKTDSFPAGATVMPVAAVLACLTFIGCGSGGGGGASDSGNVSWSACSYIHPGLPCVMQAASIPQYAALSLGSHVVGRVHDTSQHAAGIQVTIDFAARDHLSAFVDSKGELYIGLDPEGLVIDIWREDNILHGISIDSTSALTAPMLSGVSTIKIRDTAAIQVDRLSGDNLEVFTGSSSSLRAPNGIYKSVKVHQMPSSEVAFGTLTTDAASLVLSNSSSFTGMITTKALEVNISASAIVQTSVSSDVDVRGTCSQSSVLEVTGGSTKGVVGPCTGVVSRDSDHAFLSYVT
eukprot:TRINITY_DN7425_c0_g1_i1.p1 TRINITY_DN7425_c0_g1~~TRINITY_DN7425_c0_g1_i1.p1  ORF type:complete len:308 (+),score=25.12 TRINITY_DN7425_c0_g1_i1:56-979(+)